MGMLRGKEGSHFQLCGGARRQLGRRGSEAQQVGAIGLVRQVEEVAGRDLGAGAGAGVDGDADSRPARGEPSWPGPESKTANSVLPLLTCRRGSRAPTRSTSGAKAAARSPDKAPGSGAGSGPVASIRGTTLREFQPVRVVRKEGWR